MALTLLFTLGETLYGLEIDAVEEIVEAPTLHYVPRATGVLRGAVNFHGQIRAAIDLPALLDAGGTGRDHRQLVLTTAYRGLVLQVGEIRRIVDLDLETLLPPPDGAPGRAVRGVAGFGDETVHLLDTGEIFARLENLYAE